MNTADKKKRKGFLNRSVNMNISLPHRNQTISQDGFSEQDKRGGRKIISIKRIDFTL